MNHSVKTFLINLLLFVIAGVGACIAGLSSAYLYLSPNLPSVETIRDVRLQTPLRIYSADGKLIGEFGEKRRRPVKLQDVPQDFINALLAAEDADFYAHSGVSLRGLGRAIFELAVTGERGSGGSTLTMQLTRNVFLSLERKFIRKFNEILLSLKLERELTKDEILELYVNYMFLGKRAYGIQAAAEVYYGKELSDLSLAQLAMIAGLFQGPSTQNPIINPRRALERRNWILERMLTLRKISPEQYQQAQSEPITASYHGSPLDAQAPYVAELAREKAIRSFGLDAYTEGYRVYTTVDSRLQTVAQNVLIDGLMAYDQRHGYRGPEQQFGNAPSRYTNIEQELTLSDIDTAPEERAVITNEMPELTQYWLSRLADVPTYGKLLPAVVSEIGEQSLTALLKNGMTVQIDWENGLAQAREYLSENALGPKPKQAADLASVGDLIRVTQKGEAWHLTQLPDIQGALVSLNPSNGAVLSIVGGFDFYESHFNRATQAYRQPGSNFKPFIYTIALENNMTAATMINDAPIVFRDAALEATWRPENDGGRFEGPMRIREALYRSRNLVSIRILRQLGINPTIEALERFGFRKDQLAKNLSLALGTHSVTPQEMAEAWATFANGGYKVSAHLIKRVVDLDGNIVYEALPDTVCERCDEAASENAPQIASTSLFGDRASEVTVFESELFELPLELKRQLGLLEPEDYPRARKIVSDQVIFIMDSILRDVIQRGTGVRAKVLERRDIAGKTGTTNGPLDAWFSGYHHRIVTTTWVGFDQNRELGANEYGGSAALPIWIDYMREALKDRPVEFKQQPPGVVTVKIDPETGARARPGDPDAIFEYFRVENVPEELEEGGSDTQGAPLDIFSEEIF